MNGLSKSDTYNGMVQYSYPHSYYFWCYTCYVYMYHAIVRAETNIQCAQLYYYLNTIKVFGVYPFTGLGYWTKIFPFFIF